MTGVDPFSSGNSLAVAIKGPSSPNGQRHVAFLFKSAEGRRQLLHLGWHQDLRIEPWNGGYILVEFDGVEKILQEVIAINLEAVAIANFGEDCAIQYSGHYQDDETYFDDNFKYVNLKDGAGLTCATFILAVLKRLELQLIDSSSWPKGRMGDVKWLDFILNKLEETLGVCGHIVSQRKYKNLLRRFRPEEVAVSSGLYVDEPIKFEVANKQAKKFLHQLN